MILDVGSGTPSASHVSQFGENVLHVDIDRRISRLGVVCDIHHLPFRGALRTVAYGEVEPPPFGIVHASHVLEHVENPYQAVKELGRVSSHTVIVKVPNGMHYRLHDHANHIYSWNSVTLRNLLKRFYSCVTIQTGFRLKTTTRGVKRKIYTLKTLLLSAMFEPNELIAICKK